MTNEETIFIISAILGIWTWIFKTFVIEALQKSIDNLADTIQSTSERVHSIDSTMQEHGVMLKEIDRRINKLEDEYEHDNQSSGQS